MLDRFFSRFVSRQPAKKAPRRPGNRARLSLETLEARVTPAGVSLTGYTDATFLENTVNAAPQTLAPDVTVSSPDNQWAGGTLTVSGLLPEDRVGLPASGAVSRVGNNVVVGGTTIGTVGTGAGQTGVGQSLVITFNASAKDAGVEAVVEALGYQNTSNTPTASRKLSVVLTDGMGTASVPEQGSGAYVEASASANPFPALGVGGHAMPKAVDLDADGDLDLVVGRDDGSITYALNVGTASAPQFVVQAGDNNPFLGIDNGGNAVIDLGDLDGDGDLDMVTSSVDGGFLYFENTGTASAPNFVERTGEANPLNGFNVVNYGSPAIGDVDGDGDLDIMSKGSGGAASYYFRNDGTAQAPSFAQVIGSGNPFGGITTGTFDSTTLADADGDGDLDLLVGVAGTGTVDYYENTGTPTAPVYTARTGAQNPFAAASVGVGSYPDLADLNGDGVPELLVGNIDAEIAYYVPDQYSLTVNVTPEAEVPPVVQFTTSSETIDARTGTFSVTVTLTGTPSGDPTVSTHSTGYVNPEGLAFDAAGNLFVTNKNAGTVSKITPAGVVSTVASGLSVPHGLAFDAAGNLFIANQGAGTVEMMTPTGVVSTFASGFNTPSSLAFDAAGNLFVADYLAGTVSKVTPGGVVSAFASDFSGPEGIAFDAAGNLYVTNGVGGTVSKVTPGGVVSEFATEFSHPFGLAFDEAGTLYVANFGNGTVSAVTPGGVVSTFASGFNQVTGLAFDAAGNLYATDYGTGTVNVFGSIVTVPYTLGGTAVSGTDYSDVADGTLTFLPGRTTATITGSLLSHPGVNSTLTFTLGTPTGGTLGGTTVNTLNITQPAAAVLQFSTGSETIDAGAGTFSVTVTTTGTPTSAPTVSTLASGLSNPLGMVFDAAGNLYVANYGNGTVSKVTPAGAVSTFASGFDYPIGLAFDTAGNLYVANGGTRTVSKVTPAGVVSTFATGTGNQGMAFDAAGNLYVADYDYNTVSKVTPEGVVSTFASGFNGAYGLAFDAAGDLYVTNFNGNTVSKVTPAGVVSTFASGVTSPYALQFDSAGNLLVTNTYVGTVSKVTPAGVVSTFASGFNVPDGLAIDAAGNLYVGSFGGGTVSVFGSVVTVPYTLGGTAVSGTDYSDVADGTLTFLPGRTTATITGSLLSHPGVNSTLTFTLGTPTGGTLGGTTVNTLNITQPTAAPVVTGPATTVAVNTSTQVIQGTAPAFSLVQVYIDANNNGVIDEGDTVVASQQLGDQFDYSIATPLTQNADNHFLVTATASPNTESSPVDVPTITQDSSAPGAPSTPDLTPASDSGPSATDNITSDTTPTFTGTGEVGATVTVYQNYLGSITQLGTTTVQEDGTWSYTPSTPLAQGVRGIFSRQTDAAGNTVAVSGTLGLTVDTDAPGSAVVTSPASGTYRGSGAAGATLWPGSIAGTAFDYMSAVGLVEVRIVRDGDGAQWNGTAFEAPGLPVFSPATGTASWAFGFPAANFPSDGAYTVTVRAVDLAGNVSAVLSTVNYTIDTTAPAAPTVSSPGSAATVDAATRAVAGTAEGGSLVKVYRDVNNNGVIDAGDVVVGQQQTDSSGSFSIETPLTQDAANDFLVSATDAAGNESVVADVPTITEDSIIPAAPSVTSPTVTQSVDVLTFVVAGTAEAGALVKVYRDVNNNGVIDEGDTVVAMQQLGEGQTEFSIATPLAPNAANNFLVTASDAAGHESGPADVPTVYQGSQPVSGTVSFDYDGDGTRDPGDTGLAGRTVYLDLNGNLALDSGEPTAVTDSEGAFRFDQVFTGTYTLRRDLVFTNIALTGESVNGLTFTVGAEAVSGLDVTEVHFETGGPPRVDGPSRGSSEGAPCAAYVRGVYRSVLGREGSDIDVANFVATGLSNEQLARTFVTSAEHRGLQVDHYYRTFLRRDAEFAGRQAWVNYFLAGATEADVLKGILTSTEYNNAHPDAASFVTDLFVGLLGRVPSADEVAFHMPILRSPADRAAMVEGFLRSPEAARLAVKGYFAAYLFRDADLGAGADDWLALVRGGVPLGDVQVGILVSDEFVANVTRPV